MAIQSKETIKSYFETGDAPTQSDFEDFIDSYADTARPTLDKQLFTTGDKGQIYIGNREMTPNNLKLTDIGATWNEDTNVGSAKQWRSVSISSDGKYQTAVVYNGQIYTCKASDFIDGKLTVSEEIISQKLTIKGTEFDNDSASNQVIYMVGSTESSNNWTAVESDRLWVSVSMSSDGRYQTAVVFGGQIYISDDYGATWTAVESTRNWRSVSMSSDGRYQTAVVLSGQIYISDDYGATWTAVESNRSWHSVSMSSDGKYQTAVVLSGQIYISDDYGATWTAVESNRSWYSVSMSSDGRYQTAVVVAGQIYISDDYGATWTAVNSTRDWYSVSMSSDGRYQTAVVFGGQIYTTELFSLLFQYDIPEAKTIILNSESLALVDYTFDIASWQYKVIAQNNGVVSEIVKIRDMNDGSEKTADVWYEGNMLDETLGDTKLFFNLVNDTINIYVRSVDKTKFNTNVTIQQLLGKSQQGYS